VIASWCRYLKAVKESGEAYTVADPMAQQLVAKASHKLDNYPEHVADILSFSGICNSELLDHQAFVNKVAKYFEMIEKKGIKVALASFGAG